jgi:hypothetical protein
MTANEAMAVAQEAAATASSAAEAVSVMMTVVSRSTEALPPAVMQ